MIIKSIKLSDYRNYEALSLDFDKGINIFYGDNAQGKTNLLEALYMSVTTKSHKNVKDRECIRFTKSESHIRTVIERGAVIRQIDMHLRASKGKGIALDGVRMKKASEFLKKLSARVIFFAPEDLELIKGAPAGRRRYLNLALCQQDAAYMDALSKYTKTLDERAKILQSIKQYSQGESPNSALDTLLSVYDEELVKNGSYIIKARKIFIEELSPLIKTAHEKLSGGKEELKSTYQPNVTEDEFKNTLKENRFKDINTVQTNCGPQRDDVNFEVRRVLDGKLSDRDIDIRHFGSQGQQRTAALSMKLAEIELVKKRKGEDPVMLLDDVLPELDENRQNELLNAIGFLQTIITCTGLDDFVMSRLKADKIFKVTDGTITAEN